MKRDGSRKIPGTSDEWISHAKSDLRMASLASADRLVLGIQACFHAQQAAEKAIKAVLLSRSIRFPLTHDIEDLFEIAEYAGMALPKDVADAGRLTPYAVETRYPGYWHEITVKWADELIEKS